MARFLRNLIAFGALVLLLDLPFRWAMAELPKREYDDRLRRVLEDSLRYDVLVFGSSRASRDVIAHRITEIAGISAFNLGYPGASIEFQEFVLRQVLHNLHRPHTVLLVVDDPSEIVRTHAVDFRLDRSYPLAGYEQVNAEICERSGKSPILTRLLASYRIKECLSNLWDPPRPDQYDTVFADGSMPSRLRAASMDTAIYRTIDRPYSTKNETPELRNTFLRFVQECADAHVRLVIVHPPDLRSPNEVFIERIAELTKSVAEVYRYDASNPAYGDPKNYFDPLHLNRQGAEVFSTELGERLKLPR